jgi:S-adenosylmethionine hydrolase
VNRLPPTVTLLTDFGQRDGYAGALKGAVLAACPEARLVDLTHEIPPGDIDCGARVLAQAAPLFPEGTVHLAVVDPGVGSARRALAARIDGRCYVAPDNGLLSGVLEGARAVCAHELTRAEHWRPAPSPVFHGRDVFGPVAGRLAGGLALEAVGPPLDPAGLARRAEPSPRRQGPDQVGEVIAVDGFGNLITNLRPPETGARVELAGRSLPLLRTYSDVPEGELLALVGSHGCVEIACNRARADRVLGASRGLVVVLRASGEPA